MEVGKGLFFLGSGWVRALKYLFLVVGGVLIFILVLITLEIIGNLRRKKVGSFFNVTTFAFRNRGHECGIQIGWFLASTSTKRTFFFSINCSSQSCCNLMSLLSIFDIHC